MKKIVSILLVLTLCLTICACGKSEAATHVDSMILSIGTVTLDSESSVKAAETAYLALTPEQQDELENTAILAAARATLDGLLEQKAKEDAEAERIAILQAQASDVDSLISAIGEVTVDAATAIAEARTAYDALDEETQGYVTTIAALEQAETMLHTAQANEVIALIDSIGTVSLESGEAIKVAEAAYNTITDTAKKLVNNADVLTAAQDDYLSKLTEFGESYLKKLRKVEDRVRGISFYYASGFPYYERYDYWGADIRSFVLPYLGVQGNNVWLRLVCDYTADDWIFFKKITFAVDDQRFYRFYNYFDVVRDNAYGDIWEYVDVDVDSNDIELLHAIANSDETIVRFEGDDYYDDITIRDSDKQAIADMLLLYEYFQNT